MGETRPAGRAVDDAAAGAPTEAPAVLTADAERLGRYADTPADIPWPGWKAVIRRTAREAISDRVSLVSAGCAFWATLALFPAITMLIFLYGLVFDPATVEPQLQVLARFVPPAAFELISERVHHLVTQRHGSLGIGLVVSTAVALWSSATATKSMLSALNMAYEEHERRSFLRFQFVALAITFCAIVGAALAVATLVFMPAVIGFLGLSGHARLLLRAGSLGVLLLFVLAALSLLYRFGPSRRQARWHWVTPGSILATVLWLLASTLFTLYVTDLANYDATYGPLGAVAATMMWFWVSTYAVLLGAELNSELELQTARDSTEGPPKPMGRRGAYVADHVSAD